MFRCLFLMTFLLVAIVSEASEIWWMGLSGRDVARYACANVTAKKMEWVTVVERADKGLLSSMGDDSVHNSFESFYIEMFWALAGKWRHPEDAPQLVPTAYLFHSSEY